MMPFVSHRSCGDTPSLYTHCTGTLLAQDTPWPHHVETPSLNNACLHQIGTPLNLVPFCRHHAGSGTPGPTHFPEMFTHVHLGLHYTVTPPPGVFKIFHCVAQTVGKRSVAIQFKCLLVYKGVYFLPHALHHCQIQSAHLRFFLHPLDKAVVGQLLVQFQIL